MAEKQELFERAALRSIGVDRPDRDDAQRFDRVRRGVYGFGGVTVPTDPEVQYRRRVLASSRTLTGDRIYSHESAAVLLGLPVLGRWPDTIHLIAERRSGGRSQLDVVRHCTGLEDVDPISLNGELVTSPARTVLDLAVGRAFAQAVVTADAALRLFPDARRELEELVDRYATRRGHLKLQRVLAFADGRSESVGESYSRVLIQEAGLVAPVLQFAVRTWARTEYTDFAWVREGIAGEFDGEAKYREDRYRRGGSAEDVVVREKNRENRIRRSLPNVIRWDWTDLRRGRLPRMLRQAGVPEHITR